MRSSKLLVIILIAIIVGVFIERSISEAVMMNFQGKMTELQKSSLTMQLTSLFVCVIPMAFLTLYIMFVPDKMVSR
jgi:hypothetical protein